MQQTDFAFATPSPVRPEVVNVASVPQRSPFRYPGGKTWLVPVIRKWLQSTSAVQLVEPFAGGGIVSLTAVFEDFVDRAVMVEKDPNVSAVWQTILNGNADWLVDRILEFEVSRANVQAIFKSPGVALHERAFATILRNRVQRGGILAPGAGLAKVGENGRGLLSRWYPETLKKRILAIASFRHRICFSDGDGMEYISRFARDTTSAFFIDPPYTVAGRRLYACSELDHRMLFSLARTIEGDFLMTYDDCPEIRELAHQSGFDTMQIPMKNTHHACKQELLIAKSLERLRRLASVTSPECELRK